ncbi:MAG: tRNA (adenosine(37)-N6)-threonylcarbamoyltransferase complex dimerization subunit type 1 TsaB [Cytophagales bacterium]|nr:tRNA (adenosine(37)-N6)-threonylcarbamoyltransferase complex dimerization subunit type 1 TsaB [Bernardetiaceae bacterium]MDW8209860.1 tRNA (adenosine(37)-N6)-threonylcarbamoyltransferase complex dimerization subunit type 1 TsaB [Cytophagales bacterium]
MNSLAPYEWLLSIETSTNVCSVALHYQGRLIAFSELHQEKMHSSRLTLLIEELLNHCQLSITELSAVAISAGPGSYTGLRIGVSTAKGICFGLNIPLLAVDSLHAFSYGVAQQSIVPEQVLLCPCVDARRMEIYRAVWQAEGKCLLTSEPHVLQPSSFAEFSQYTLWLFGSGAEKTYATIEHPRKYLLPHLTPSARFVGEVALAHPHLVDLAYFEPYYVKPVYTTVPKKPANG